MSRLIERLFGRGEPATRDAEIDYEQACEMARQGDAEQRRGLAARPDLAPEILYYLAEDEDGAVRRTVAANPGTPEQADLLLAADVDAEVRTELARKITRLAPDLPSDTRNYLQELTMQALDALARDTLPRVRRIVAEEIKELDNLPRALVRRLAHDIELVVCTPILEYSPLLRDEDLLEIISSPPIRGALSAVSRRNGLSEKLSEAVVAANDPEAVAALLGNTSAQIREETLDRILDDAPAQEEWHEPLVLRPHLSARAMGRISRFVSAALLDILVARDDLDQTASREIAKRVSERLDNPDGEAAEQEVATLQRLGLLTEEAMVERIDGGERDFVMHALAALSGFAVADVKNVFTSRNAKTITALTWKAGLSMRTAIALQTKIGRLDHGSVLYAKDGVDYPMDEEELNWRVEVIAG